MVDVVYIFKFYENPIFLRFGGCARSGRCFFLRAVKETPIVTYCAAGVRAQSAVDMLVQEGYTDAVNGGGYSTQLESICQACFSTSRESTSSFDLAASSSFADDLTSTSTVPLMTSGAAEFTSFPTVLLLSLFCLRCIRGFH
eukprot:g32085.t2